MTDDILVKVRMGMRANGSCQETKITAGGFLFLLGSRSCSKCWRLRLTCRLCSTLRKSFMPVKCWISLKMATKSVGVMASERVSRTRANLDHRRFKKPWVKEWKSASQLVPNQLFKDHVLSTDLHHKLARVGPRHSGALTCCQYPHCPDVEGHGAKKAAQDHTLQTEKQICGRG